VKKYALTILSQNTSVFARKRDIVELTEVENMHHQNIDTLQNDIDHLFNERRRQFVYTFKNSNEKYLKIKDAA
jgi:hypothetical protein